MKFYKAMCLVIAIDIAFFGVISLFYKPNSGTTIFTVMKVSFLLPLITASILQLMGLIVNIIHGHVYTPRMYELIEIRCDESPLLFFYGIAQELVLWTLPLCAMYQFLHASN